MMSFAVETKNLTRRFGSFTAVNAINLAVLQGEIFGFLGANGAGKTTLIRMLCGLLAPSEGEGTVGGYDIAQKSEQIKKIIGYMSQKFSLYDDLQVKENLEFWGGIYKIPRQKLKDRMTELLINLELSQEKHTLTKNLPLGLKQRLALGCCLIHDPQIIFLDEPTSGVDPKVRRTFWDIIYQQAETGKTVFVTTHFMDEAEYCQRVLIMDQGIAKALDNPHNLKHRYHCSSMQDVFIAIFKQQKASYE